MTRKNSRTVRALCTAAAALTAALTLSAAPAHADSEHQMVKEASALLCPEQPVHHKPIWYTAVTSWQAMQPYDFKMGLSPDSQARLKLYGEEAFNERTRQMMCDNIEGYGEALKAQILDHKGDLKRGCATARGMEAFYDHKLEALRAIEQHDWQHLDDLMPGWRNPKVFAYYAHLLTCTQLTGVAD